jgi:hypothetical protein
MTCDHILDETIFRLLHDDKLIEEFIDRSNAEIPDTFVPSAIRIAVGTDDLLLFAEPMALYDSMRRSNRWFGSAHGGLFRMVGADSYILSVRRYGKLWSIERQRLGEKSEVLAFGYGPTPIFYHNFKAAMALAKHCHPNPREEAQCLRWVLLAA